MKQLERHFPDIAVFGTQSTSENRMHYSRHLHNCLITQN